MGGGEIGRRSPEWRCRVRVYVMLVSSVWCLLAPSRGGVPPLGDTQSAELTLGDPCLFYVGTLAFGINSIKESRSRA